MYKDKKNHYQEILDKIITEYGEDKFSYSLFGERLNASEQRAKRIVNHYKLDIPSLKSRKKRYYQDIIDDLIKKVGKDKFTFRLFGEQMNSSKQRAKQIVDYYGLVIPSTDYFGSKECADLKALIESKEVEQYTLQDLYEGRYKKFLPKSFISAHINTAGRKLFKSSDKLLYGQFFSKTQTANKTKAELFAEVQAMFPDRQLNFSTFCSDMNDRKIPFKRMRKESSSPIINAYRQRYDEWQQLISTFLEHTATNPSLYARDELHTVYDDFAKRNGMPSIEYFGFRESLKQNKVPFARTKPLALLNRLSTLGMDLKATSLSELTARHNALYPLMPIIQNKLNNYSLKAALGRD